MYCGEAAETDTALLDDRQEAEQLSPSASPQHLQWVVSKHSTSDIMM